MKHVFSDAETKLGTQRGNQAQKTKAQKRLTDYLETKGFQLIGEYEGSSYPVVIKCLKCGETQTRNPRSIRKDGVMCHKCKAEYTQLLKETRRKEQIRIKEEAKAQKIRDKEKATNERLKAQHICKVCGTPYSINDYMKSTGMKYRRNSGFCSDECRNKYKRTAISINRRNGNRVHTKNIRRAKKFGGKIERGITLRKLIQRNGLRCAICGKMCDWNDRSWNGHCGPLYPSMDHIIPMSKGGGHTWDNVQVAHMICNDRKFVSVPENAT